MIGRPYDHYTYRGKSIKQHRHPHGGARGGNAGSTQRKTVAQFQGANPRKLPPKTEEVTFTLRNGVQQKSAPLSKADAERVMGFAKAYGFKAESSARVQGGSAEPPRAEYKPAPQAKIGKDNSGRKVSVATISTAQGQTIASASLSLSAGRISKKEYRAIVDKITGKRRRG